MIRVKDFAKFEQSQPNDTNERQIKNENDHCSELPIDIEIISLSSNDDVPPPASSVAATPSKQSVQKTPAKRRTKRLNGGVSTPSTRTPKPPSTYKYHKIDEYFSASKKTECKSKKKHIFLFYPKFKSITTSIFEM